MSETKDKTVKTETENKVNIVETATADVTFEEIMNSAAPTKKKVYSRSKKKKVVHTSAIVYISVTSNNTLLTATTKDNKVIAWSSAGTVSFKGAKKATPYAAQEAARDLSNKMNEFGVKSISIITRGIDSGRESALKTLYGYGFLIEDMQDYTTFAFNGTRQPRRRRV